MLKFLTVPGSWLTDAGEPKEHSICGEAPDWAQVPGPCCAARPEAPEVGARDRRGRGRQHCVQGCVLFCADCQPSLSNAWVQMQGTLSAMRSAPVCGLPLHTLLLLLLCQSILFASSKTCSVAANLRWLMEWELNVFTCFAYSDVQGPAH